MILIEIFPLVDESVHGYQMIFESGSAPSLRQWQCNNERVSATSAPSSNTLTDK